MPDNQPFEFTKSQREKLLAAWKQPSAETKAREFIKHVEFIIESHIVNALPVENSPHQERDERQKIHALTRRLRGALLSQSVLGGHMLERFLETEHQAPENADRRSHHRNQIIAYLESVDRAMTILLSEQIPSIVRKGDSRRIRVMRGLVNAYRIHFGKYPSASGGTPFRHFLSSLALILSMQLGKDLLVRATQDVKNQLQRSDEIQRELSRVFPGVIPDPE